MLSALPPARLCKTWALPPGATRVTTRSPIHECTMCTSTVADADAAPGQLEMVIADSTVERSGIRTSMPLVAEHPVESGVGLGLGVGVEFGMGVGVGEGAAVGVGVGAVAPRLMVQESMRPTSAAAASCTRSLQLPLAGSDDRFTV